MRPKSGKGDIQRGPFRFVMPHLPSGPDDSGIGEDHSPTVQSSNKLTLWQAGGDALEWF